MTGYLLDTNVLSELTRDVPHPRVVNFLSEQPNLWLSSILIHELEYGLHLLPPGHRRELLTAVLADIVSAYGGRILSLDKAAASWAARLQAQARQAGRNVDVGDALIAGIAWANELTIATRNVSDFQDLGVTVTNPWEST